MIETIVFIWKTRYVWLYSAWLKSKAQFSRTTFGGFWIGLSNLLTVSVLGLVYSTIFKVPNPNNYFIYIAIGLTIWHFLAISITGGIVIYEQNRIRLLNTNLQPLFFNLEFWAFNLMSFVQAFVLVTFVTFIMQPSGLIGFLMYGGLPLLNICIGSFTLSLLTSLFGARFRDLSQIVPVFLQLALLSSPILYPEDTLTQHRWLVTWNPLYQLVKPLRSAIVDSSVDLKLQIIILMLNILCITLVISLYRLWRPKLPFWL